MRTLVAVLGLAFLPGTAGALGASDCAALTDFNARMACVREVGAAISETRDSRAAARDQRLEDRAATAQEWQAHPHPLWRTSMSRSPLDDSPTVVLSRPSRNVISNSYGQAGPGMLVIRCRENTTSAYLTFNGHFMADIQGRGRVDYRVDQRPAGHRRMTVSTDNESLGAWSGNQSIPWIREMLDADQLYIRATPFNESPVSLTFDIRGLDEAIAPLRDACNW